MNRTWIRDVTTSSYPAVQLGLPPELRGLRDREIEALVEERLSGASAEEVENFMRSLRSFGKAAAPVAQRALPGVIQGAATGAAAGPWGALIGGVVGGTAGALSGGGQRGGRQLPSAPRQPRAPAGPTPVAIPVASPRPAPRPAPAAPSGAAPPTPAGEDQIVAATARLLLLLARPEVQNALLAMLMGNAGRRSVRVGGGAVPVEAMAEALAEATADLASAANGQSRFRLEYA